MAMKMILPLVGVLGLAACGGGGGGGGPSFAQLDSEADTLLSALSGSATVNTIPSGPGSGTAEYEGVIVMTDDTSSISGTADGFIGDVFLQANFATASMTGTAGGFYAVQVDSTTNPTGPSSPIGGSLNFTNSAPIAGGSSGLTLNVSGTLDVNGTGDAISGSMTGEFGNIGGNSSGTPNIVALAASGPDITVGGGGAIADLDAALIAIDN